MKLCEGMTVCLDIKSLYDEKKDLAFGTIVFSLEGNQNYYDLYNENGELAYMDGEEVMIDQIGHCLITFRNTNGDGTIYFALTYDECEIAMFEEED